MRKRRYVYGAVVGLLSSVLLAGPLAQSSVAVDVNLIANPGFEVSSNHTNPDGWHQDSWGTNSATFGYVTDAHTGTAAVETSMTTYQDGDAKWLFDPVEVTIGSSYSYADYSKSDADTNLWAQLVMDDGTFRYEFLKVVPATGEWTRSSVDLVVPTGVTELSIFHVLASVGNLYVDDVSLTAVAASSPPCTPDSVDGLSNGGFEDACPATDGIPAGWAATHAGNTTAAYSDTAQAYQGAHAESITNGTDGAEAGLSTSMGDPLSDQRYRLGFAQSGYTYVYAYVTIGLSDGTTRYQSLMAAPATRGAWSLYSDSFVTPSDVVSLMVTIATSGTGTVTLDDVGLDPLANQSPADFTRGLVSLTFDDGDASAYKNGLPVLETNAFDGTFYLNAGTLNSTGHVTSKQVKALASKGQEVGSHLYHHSDMVQLDDATLRSELSGNIASLQRILGNGYQVSDFASPYGSYTSGTVDTVMQYERSHRDTDGEMNTKANLDPRQIHAYPVTSHISLATLRGLLARVEAEHTWLVLVYHDIAKATASPAGGEAGYTVTPGAFKNQMAALKESGLAVQPVDTALDALEAQGQP